MHSAPARCRSRTPVPSIDGSLIAKALSWGPGEDFVECFAPHFGESKPRGLRHRGYSPGVDEKVLSLALIEKIHAVVFDGPLKPPVDVAYLPPKLPSIP